MQYSTSCAGKAISMEQFTFLGSNARNEEHFIKYKIKFRFMVTVEPLNVN
jgi:hypothetical protein